MSTPPTVTKRPAADDNIDDVVGFYDMTRYHAYEVPIDQKRIWFGRRSDRIDVGLDDERVSQEHCTAERLGGGVFRLQDCGSKNGTCVNGVQIQGTVIFRTGHRLYIGDTELVCLRTTGPDFGAPPFDEATLYAAYVFHRTYRAVRDALGVSVHAVREAVMARGGPASST